MPLYEYSCTSCSTTLERRQGFSEEPLKICPSCGGELRRVLHPTGIIFKGKGWYCTDSRVTGLPDEKTESKSCDTCAAANA